MEIRILRVGVGDIRRRGYIDRNYKNSNLWRVVAGGWSVGVCASEEVEATTEVEIVVGRVLALGCRSMRRYG